MGSLPEWLQVAIVVVPLVVTSMLFFWKMHAKHEKGITSNSHAIELACVDMETFERRQQETEKTLKELNGGINNLCEEVAGMRAEQKTQHEDVKSIKEVLMRGNE